MNPNRVYLIQTDTTVGFLSGSTKKLSEAKKRDKNQPFLITVDSLYKLKNIARVPQKYKNLVRRSEKKSFLYPNNKAVRVIKDDRHKRFLHRFEYMYSTSANRHKESFNLKYAISNADILIEDFRGFKPDRASEIIKLGKKKILKLR